MNSPQKGPVTWKLFQFDDVIILQERLVFNIIVSRVNHVNNAVADDFEILRLDWSTGAMLPNPHELEEYWLETNTYLCQVHVSVSADNALWQHDG